MSFFKLFKFGQKKSLRNVFNKVYERKKWGDDIGPFYSGSGSQPRYAQPYCEFISEIITTEAKSLTTDKLRVIDLGCGDFQVGNILTNLLADIDYTGVDVVDDLINHNNKTFANDRIRFQRLDITQDPLPAGEVVLIRQVLQHLSNQDIANVLDQIKPYKLALITEQFPAKLKKVNVDIRSGHHTRRKLKSGVCLDQPPFSVKNIDWIVSFPQKRPPEHLRLYQLENSFT